MKKRTFPTPIPSIEFDFVSDVEKENTIDKLFLEDSEKHIDNLDLFKIFRVIHNHIYANDGLSTQQAFDEILKLLFIKLDDENKLEDRSRLFITDKEFEQIQSGLKNSFRSRVDGIFKEAKADYPDIFEAGEKIKLKDTSLAFAVNNLQNYKFKDAKKDIKGLAFQKFISVNLRGERGQFFTPDPVIDFMVKMLDPNLKTKFIDPTCGSGGFLYRVINYIREKESFKGDKKENGCLKNNIHGIEINPSVAKVAKLRLLLEFNDCKGIFCTNSLSEWEDLLSAAQMSGISKIEFKNNYDLILTNPPFGSQGKVIDRSFLTRFNLAHKWKENGQKWSMELDLQGGQAPDILFLERCIDLLKDGGMLGIVLPNGDLENSSLGYVREYLRSNTKILASVTLPQETFIPHGTGVKASLLFLQKLSKDKLEEAIKSNYKIFFAIVEKIGYEGNKNGSTIYKKNKTGEIIRDEQGMPLVDEDLSEILKDFYLFKKNSDFVEKSNIFSIKYSEIEDRLDAGYYKPEHRSLKKRLVKLNALPLSEVTDIVTKKSKKLKNPEDKIKYVELSDVNSIYSELISYKEMFVHEAPSRASYDLNEGYLITAIAGNSIGGVGHASAYVTKEFDGCVCTNGFRVLIPKKVNPFYLLFYLRSDYFLNQIFQKRSGAAIPAVSDEDFKNILIPIPSVKEQEVIAEKMKESLELRAKSRLLFEELNKSYSEEKILV